MPRSKIFLDDTRTKYNYASLIIPKADLLTEDYKYILEKQKLKQCPQSLYSGLNCLQESI